MMQHRTPRARALRFLRILPAVVVLAAVCPQPAAAGGLHKKDATWLTQRYLKSRGASDKLAVVSEMASRQDPSLLPVLVRVTAESDRALRRIALDGLMAFGPAVADPQRDQAYLSALSDAAPGIRRQAQNALSERLLVGTEPGITGLWDQLSTLGQRASGWATRKAAVELLAQAPTGGPTEAIDRLLIEVARLDSHDEVRRAAATALGQRGVAAARPVLSKLRNTDSDEQVRLAAELALARIGGPAHEAVVAVMPFTTTSAALHGFAGGLQDYFTSRISAGQGATVVERNQISAVLTELRFQDAQIDDGKAVQVGQLLRADWIVTGTLQKTGDEITCLAKRVDVASGVVKAAQPVMGAQHDLPALQQACASRLLQTF